MNDPQKEGERLALRSERDRLLVHRDALVAEMADLEHSHDRDGLRDLADRLHVYAEELHAYSAKLHVFHERFGPIGP